MFTVLLALIDAKYNIDFKYLYLGTICVDMSMWDSMGKIFKRKQHSSFLFLIF